MTGGAKAEIDAINRRLKLAQLPVQLKLRGNRISLVATLPPKPDSSKVRPHQQTIALGVPASKLGRQRAEREAKTIGVELINGEFSWEKYYRGSGRRETLAQLLRRFERSHRSKHQISDATWRDHYWYYYKHLPQHEPLSAGPVMELVFSKKEHTRARKQTCKQLQKLCDFAGLDLDVLQFQGRYSSQKKQEKALEVPSDEEIMHGYGLMKSAQWRWVYGMMAAYGLRDHECWFCHFMPDGALQVEQGKTGPRLIELPVYPEWVEQWELTRVKRPKLNLSRGYKYLAEQCGHRFSLAGVPFIPYALRYAYGHRGTVLFRYEEDIMARQMGHSLEVHLRTYHRFLNDDLVQRKIAEMKVRENLPKPPSIQ